jgi:hypothetical protein
MNFTAPRFLKSFYRKEPITGLIITVGAVNAVLGGVNAAGSLFILGMMAAGGAAVWRWSLVRQREFQREDRQLYLPPAGYRENPQDDAWGDDDRY